VGPKYQTGFQQVLPKAKNGKKSARISGKMAAKKMRGMAAEKGQAEGAQEGEGREAGREGKVVVKTGGWARSTTREKSQSSVECRKKLKKRTL